MPTPFYDQIIAAEHARLNLNAAEPTLSASAAEVERLRAALALAERSHDNVKASLEADRNTWTAFAAAHPDFVPAIDARLKTLAEAGYAEALSAPITSPGQELPKTPTSLPAPREVPAAADVHDTDEPQASAPVVAEALPTALAEPATQPANPVPEATEPAPAPVKADAKRKLKDQPSLKLAVSNPPQETPAPAAEPPHAPTSRHRVPLFSNETVGPLKTLVPNKPLHSPSKKTHSEYRRIWSLNYQQGFDNAMLDQPHGATDAPGPSREGRIKGYEDGLKHKAEKLAEADDLDALSDSEGSRTLDARKSSDAPLKASPADDPAPQMREPAAPEPSTGASSPGTPDQDEQPATTLGRGDQIERIDNLLDHAVITADFSTTH